MDELYFADAHAFALYLIDALPKEADGIFENAERQKYKIFIPSIAIAELIYVLKKPDQSLKYGNVYKTDAYPSFSIHPLDENSKNNLRRKAYRATRPHHVGTNIASKADGLITKDEEIRKSGSVKTIW